jgi:predicted enzyme related to lactoylglutathione lyase
MSIKSISHFSVFVEDQDEALQWYTEKLGFVVRVDESNMIPGYRWLTISPADSETPELVLSPCQNEADKQKVGKNPYCVLLSDDCRGDCQKLEAAGVKIVSPPEDVPWGVSANFVDLYGNVYNLVQSSV